MFVQNSKVRRDQDWGDHFFIPNVGQKVEKLILTTGQNLKTSEGMSSGPVALPILRCLTTLSNSCHVILSSVLGRSSRSGLKTSSCVDLNLFSRNFLHLSTVSSSELRIFPSPSSMGSHGGGFGLFENKFTKLNIFRTSPISLVFSISDTVSLTQVLKSCRHEDLIFTLITLSAFLSLQRIRFFLIRLLTFVKPCDT